MTAVHDIDVQKFIIPQPCREATASLMGCDICGTGSLDAQFIDPQRNRHVIFAAGTAANDYYSFEKCSWEPTVVFRGDTGFKVLQGNSALDVPATGYGSFKAYTAAINDDLGCVLPNDDLAFGSAIYPELDFVEDEDHLQEASLRGIHPIDHKYKVLFSAEIEIKTSELKRWKPSSFPRIDFHEDE